MSGKVLWHATVSMDGFLADPDGGQRWMAGYGATSLAGEVIDSTGAILAGRRGYNLGAARSDKPYGSVWQGPIFVLTHRPPDRAYDPAITFVSDGVEAAIATARAAAGDKNVVLFGANVAQQCLQAGLVDELLLHVVPVLLGDGIRFNGGPGQRPVKLERTLCGESGQITDLRFRVQS